MYHDPVPWVFSALSQPLRLHCWPGPGYKNVAMPCRKRRRSQKPWIRSQKTLSSWPYLLTLWWHLGSPVITLLEPLFFSLVKWYPLSFPEGTQMRNGQEMFWNPWIKDLNPWNKVRMVSLWEPQSPILAENMGGPGWVLMAEIKAWIAVIKLETLARVSKLNALFKIFLKEGLVLFVIRNVTPSFQMVLSGLQVSIGLDA